MVMNTCNSVVNLNRIWLEIIIYQADIFIQAHKATEANFTCPLGQEQNLLSQAIGPDLFPAL